VLSFFSYRDPNLLDTLDIYDQTADYLSRLDLPAEELEKAVIGAVGDLDAYQLPDAKGYTSLVRELAGIDDAWRQAYRDQLMGASLKDFRRFGEQLKDAAGAAKVAVLASSAAFDRMEQIKPGWMTVRKAL